MIIKKIKILSNPSVTGWIYNLIQISSVVFILPLILKQFSVVEVSFWLLLSTIAGFALITDMGFSNTLIRCVSLFRAGVKELPEDVSGEELANIESPIINVRGLYTLLKTIKKVYLYINTGCFVLIIIFGFFLCYNLFTMSNNSSNLFLAFGITCIYSTINVATSMWSSYAQGLGLIHKTNYIKVVTGSIKLLTLIILLLLGSKLWLLTVVLLFEAFVNYFVAKQIVSKFLSSLPNDLNSTIEFDKGIFKILWKPTWRMAGIKLGGYLINQGNAIIVAQIPNPAIIASFMFTKRMLDFLGAISLVPFSVNINNVYSNFVSKNNQDFRREISVLLFLGVGIFTIGSIGIGLFGNPLLKFAHIDSYILTGSAFVILALTSLLEIHHSMHAGIYMASNKVPFLIPALASGILILTLGFLFVSEIGVIGLILIQFFVQLALNNWYPVYLSLRLTKWPVRKYIYEMPLYGFGGLKNFIKR
ncbi:hypothetical protein [Pedobacter sp. CFBP9032]|uniref:hypothetical protein n=1 Tax=Pedobacter sp. CFBP9032 TaxID=3096539 RepID=UPI002A6A956E|nr:hypothetical protein [Pedobacter sp. CFBP9032]MDY0907172.1 hypothetical protein [Pedobacter sp. CFBP9032]